MTHIVFSPVFWRSKDGKWALKYKDENSYVKGYKYDYLSEEANRVLEEVLKVNEHNIPTKEKI